MLFNDDEKKAAAPVDNTTPLGAENDISTEATAPETAADAAAADADGAAATDAATVYTATTAADAAAADADADAAATAADGAAAAAAVLDKYDRESAFRNRLPRGLEAATGVLFIAFSVFQIYTSIFTIQERQLRPVHLGFAMMLVYLIYPASRKLRRDHIPWYDWLLSAASVFATLYIPANLRYLVNNIGNYGPVQIVVGVAGILLLMEACRRVVGAPILIIVTAFLAYTLFGQFIIGTFGHRGYSIRQVVTHMYYTLDGVFGTPIGVSATFICLFILFGAFLDQTGVGKFFIDLANALAGKRIGGPAKVAVISSAFFGTVSGSSVANTVGTGSFTIPTMKRIGYKPEFAGAVEAAASTGGQLMPPVMGAAAFLMAESTGFPYSRIIISAIIPAVLYFTGILISVHVEARKSGLRGMSASEIPKLGPLMRERGFLLLPLAFMIYMLMTRATPAYSALAAILSSLMVYSLHWWAIIPVGIMIVCKVFITSLHFTQYALIAIGVWLLICLLRRRLGFHPMEILDALRKGARSVLAVAIACGMAGMIVGTVTLTGLGLKFATGLSYLAGGNIYLLLFFTMLSSLILGMGVPTTANYLITSTICAPAVIMALVQMNGLDSPTAAIIMGAHLFVFYFGIIADITPPVALAAMAGSAIAKAEPFKTGVTATRIAIGAFIVPYIFVLNPAMLMIDTHFLTVLQSLITALLGMYSLSGGLTGFVQDRCKWYERALLIAGGLGMIYPETVSDITGLAVLVLVFIMQKRRANSVAAAR
ncbi:MAG: TRAP transporter permease [Oscillospiraceae bacterium]|nr:TRAP transporter permease [Oscillospiraceae bacterium]